MQTYMPKNRELHGWSAWKLENYSWNAESTKQELGTLKEATELVYKSALDLINLLWLKNKDFTECWNNELEKMKNDKGFSRTSIRWKQIESFIKTYNEFKNSNKIIVDDDNSDKVLQTLIAYLNILWEKKNAAKRLAEVLNDKNSIENILQTASASWWFFGWRRNDSDSV